MNKPFVNIFEAYEFANDNGLTNEAKEIKLATIQPGVNGARVRKAMLLDLFDKHSILQEFFKQYWPLGSTAKGIEKRNFYTEQRLFNERKAEELDDAPDMEVESAQQQAFAWEADLRDFLANNLHTIEPGLKLYEDGDRSGVEYSIDGGRIDILALDNSGTPVVIELKLSRGRNHTIGQLLYYMGWVDQNLGKGQSRGMIIAREISDELVLATQRVAGVLLFKYAVSLSVSRVQ